MRETLAVQALIELEDSGSELLLERAPGSNTYLWPLARWPLASALASAHLSVTPHKRLNQRLSPFDYLELLAREILPNPRSADRLRNEVEHLFIVGGRTRTSAPRGVGNWLSDAFAQALGDRAAVIQEAEFDFFLTPRSRRPANPRTWTKDRISTRVGRAARAHPLDRVERERIIQFTQEIYSHFGDLLPPELHDDITQEVLKRASRARYDEAEFKSLLNRINPRRIYMEEAAYGHYAGYNRLAHERGIEVAELQHGWIGSSHAAYNYGRAWFDSPLTSSLPDTLLTFGDYWGENLRFPGKAVPVGKPLLEFAAESAPPYTERPHRLLVVSSVYEYEKLTAAAILLQQLLPASWEIVLRPHPSERADAETLFATVLSRGISIDQELDVNTSISSSRAVVGMVSTVLFEALPLGVHIGVIETGLAEFYADATTFPQRLDDNESFSRFARTISDGGAPPEENIRTIWRTHPVESFLEFCEAKR